MSTYSTIIISNISGVITNNTNICSNSGVTTKNTIIGGVNSNNIMIINNNTGVIININVNDNNITIIKITDFAKKKGFYAKMGFLKITDF